MSKYKVSLAFKNAAILLITLIPFLIGMGVSIAKSDEISYFGKAINISGSQRMRTMLISDFSQKIYYEDDIDIQNEYILLLEDEIDLFHDYMESLISGDINLDIETNGYPEIILEINLFDDLFHDYLNSANDIVSDPTDLEAVEFIKSNALTLKDNIHKIVELFEEEYDAQGRVLQILNYYIIFISIVFTVIGLGFTRKIKMFEMYSSQDFLTGLKTRRVMYEVLRKSNMSDLSVFFIDLDKFKNVNDTYGHDIGDEVLIASANRLVAQFGSDCVFRFGGDEFVVLKEIESAKLNQSVVVLQDMFTNPIQDSNDNQHFIGCSIGVVSGTAVFGTPEEIITFADNLMYDSKNSSAKAKICLTYEDAIRRKDMRVHIIDALKNNNISSYFQRIVNATGKTVGYEALARWNFEGHVIEPDDFLPLLRRSGMMEELDIYIINEVNIFFSNLPKKEQEYVYIAVNITPEFLNSINFKTNIDRMNLFHIPKTSLFLEVSEKILVDNFAFSNVRRLHELGYSIVMDDFAGGESSLDSLKLTYIHRVKFDKAIVNEISKNFNIVKQITTFLHSLDKKVLIEGIESESQFEAFKEIGVDYFQGFLFGKPEEL